MVLRLVTGTTDVLEAHTVRNVCGYVYVCGYVVLGCALTQSVMSTNPLTQTHTHTHTHTHFLLKMQENEHENFSGNFYSQPLGYTRL